MKLKSLTDSRGGGGGEKFLRFQKKEICRKSLYTKTIIHLSVDESGGNLPPLR